jgi:hypothetical protein
MTPGPSHRGTRIHGLQSVRWRRCTHAGDGRDLRVLGRTRNRRRVRMRPHPGWAGILLSGIARIVMAVLIAAGWACDHDGRAGHSARREFPQHRFGLHLRIACAEVCGLAGC